MNIFKGLLIIFLSSFIGIMSNPEILMASDSVAIHDLDRANETVVVETPVVVAEAPVHSVQTPARVMNTPVVATSTPAPVVKEAPVVSKNTISIGGRTLDIVDVSNTSVDAGNHVNKFGDKFLYAHNAANTFGVLYNLGQGSTFSITYGGVTKNYRVETAPVIYAKVNGTTLNLNGVDVDMSVVAKKARYSGVGNFDLALMTCYGTSYGNGDASHRLVLFANEM